MKTKPTNNFCILLLPNLKDDQTFPWTFVDTYNAILDQSLLSFDKHYSSHCKVFYREIYLASNTF